MYLLSIGKVIHHTALTIDSIELCELTKGFQLDAYDYIIINGGDGSIRRVMKTLQGFQNLPPFILNPTGSFNVIAKLHRVPKMDTVLQALSQKKIPETSPQLVYVLNQEVFLFSAGNMGDLQHIFLSETLRFGILEKGITKYLLSAFFLFPLHLVMTPFMLISKRRFFIFTPLSFIKKLGSFYGEVNEMTIDLKNEHNMLELDGDIVIIEASILQIKPHNTVHIVSTLEKENSYKLK